MKYQSALLILSIFATEYTSATRRDGLGAPAQSDLTVLDQDASDGVHILEELTTDPDSDAPTSSEHEYGFEREPINWNSLEKWSNPPSTNESAFERTDESMVGDAAVERELMETPTSTSGEPERDVKPIARRLRRRIEPAVEKRSNSDDKESLRDLTIPLVSCCCKWVDTCMRHKRPSHSYLFHIIDASFNPPSTRVESLI